ncbi:hypothetical protein [Serinicoccus kebangsaanensis]|uniref:hypothetical protein n=1 Tax=Serinicoccus kebangsaanensis TaxID=2602069 RepID=UPI00124D2713|nr:hypothetical protein [Serinicoccus kebangsaanensis]
MHASTRRNIAAAIMLLLMLAPFIMLTDPSSDVGHKALLASLGLVVVCLWRVCVALWGPIVALLTWGTAWPLYFLISWLLAAGLWPAPDHSWGHFSFLFPIWVAIVLLAGGTLVHLLETEHRQATSPPALRTSDA